MTPPFGGFTLSLVPDAPLGLPSGWAEADLTDLHPDLAVALRPLLVSAVTAGLRPRRRSGARGNVAQGALFTAYKAAQGRWIAGGKVGAGPLPAAPPGASAHNYAVCPQDATHVIGPNPVCPVCSSRSRAASLALDVALLDIAGVPIYSGGGRGLAARPAEWRQWSAVVAAFPALRDGGTFAQPDPVHVELARWDHTSRTLRP